MKLNLILLFIFQSVVCFGQWSNYSNDSQINRSDIEYKISLVADGSVYSIKNTDSQYSIEKITSCQDSNAATNHVILSKTVNHCGVNKLKVQHSPDNNFIIIQTPKATGDEDKIINIYLKPKTYERVGDHKTEKKDNKGRKTIAWFNNKPLA